MPCVEHHVRAVPEADEGCKEPLDESRLFQIYASGVYDATLGRRVRCVSGETIQVSRFLHPAAYYPAIYLRCCRTCVGDIGEVSKKDIEADNYYIRGDYIGKQGIEKSYEKYLRGEKGWRFCFVMRMDVFRALYGWEARPSLCASKNLTLGIDIELQRLGERLLQHKIGAIVAIEPATERYSVWFLLLLSILT